MTNMVGTYLLNMESLILLMVIVTAASFAKGVTTMGLNLICIPIIATLFDVQTAVVATLLPKTVSDIYMTFESRDGGRSGLLRSITAFAISGALAVACATVLLASLDDRVLTQILGVCVLVFVLLQFLPRPPVIPTPQRSAWGVPFGLVSGLSQGLTGVAGPTTAMYLHSMALNTTSFVYVSSMIYVALDALQLSAFVWFGLYSIDRIMVSVLLIAPVMIGTWLGIRCRRRLSVKRFRQALLVMLLFTAVALFAKGL